MLLGRSATNQKTQKNKKQKQNKTTQKNKQKTCYELQSVKRIFMGGRPYPVTSFTQQDDRGLFINGSGYNQWKSHFSCNCVIRKDTCLCCEVARKVTNTDEENWGSKMLSYGTRDRTPTNSDGAYLLALSLPLQSPFT